MSRREIELLSDSELGPVLRHGFWELFGRMPTDRDIEEDMIAVRAGHWAPGLPTARGGGRGPGDLSSIGL